LAHFKKEPKVIIEILLNSIFINPFGLFLVVGSFEMTTQSFLQHEISSDPGGLKYRFLIKGVSQF